MDLSKLNFSANISLLFTEYALLERIGQAAEAGCFKGIEVQFPYAHPAEAWAEELNKHNLPLVLFNLPAGDWAEGERGIACLPERRDEFRAGVTQAIAYAARLGTKQINCIAGVLPPALSPQAAQEILIDNLCYAATALHAQGLRLLLESINTFDIPNFFVNQAEQALKIIEAVRGRTRLDNIYLQYDIYHAARMLETTSFACAPNELNTVLARHLAQFTPYIRHIQLADHPGRHEPGTGRIDFYGLFALLQELGYTGFIGCEYHPYDASSGGTMRGIKWLEQLRSI